MPTRRTGMLLAWLAAAWIGGIAATALFGPRAWMLAMALAASMLAVSLLRRDRRLILLAIILPAIAFFATLRFEQARPALADDAAAHYNDGPAMRLRGVLREDPEVRDTSQRFAVSVQAVQLRGDWVPASGGVLVRTALLPRFLSGDVVEFEGKLASPPDLERFDYASYLAERGIRSVAVFPSMRVVGHEDDNLVRATILHLRRRLSHGLELALPEPQASLAKGVLLGERSALPPDVASDLNATNTSHLVVVSGQNVVLVSAFVTALFAWVFGRRKALLLSILAVAAYATLVGASPPVLRGTIMGMLLIVAQFAGRPSSGLVSILVAAALMLGAHPGAARDVSFQLSFAATAGIVYLGAPLRAWIIEWTARALRRDDLPRWYDAWFASTLATTVAATVATGPLIAVSFGRVSTVGILANILIVPAFPLILIASLAAAIGGSIPHLHLVLAWPAHYLLTYWLAVVRSLAALPHAVAPVGAFTSAWAATTYVAITAVAFVLLRRSGEPLGGRLRPPRESWRVRRVVVALCVPAATLAITTGFVVWPDSPARLHVTVLDVGQGDAILIQTPRGDDILIDGGPGRAVLRGLGDEMAWHDRSIELVVLTHSQTDHATGLLDVFARYDVRRVMMAAPAPRTALSAAWQRALDDERAPVMHAEAGSVIDLGDGVRLEVLWPSAGLAAEPLAGNDASMVLRLSWGEVSFLLTGDIEAAAERALLDSGVDLASTVLKVAHHGSTTSTTRTFVDAVQPQVAVISAGANNRFGHPAPAVVARLDDGAAVFNTGHSGAVRMQTDGQRLWVSTDR